ncbi:MAG: tetratricopeptide repeat-containing serine protease family protein, partial [Methylocella sp.]
RMYAYGQGVPQDYAEAFRWFRQAAAQEDSKAQVFLGVMYANGLGVARDDAEAFRWYSKAAKQGIALAQRAMGQMYAEGTGVSKDDAEAVRWYRKAAEQGDTDAQCSLGAMFQFGRGMPQDYAEALRLYRKAAAQENPRAQALLGNMYHKGLGVPQDASLAIHWYRNAAEQGYALGQALLGVMYRYGQGARKDYIQAYMWYNLAAGAGERKAAEDRDNLARLMTAAQIAEAQQRTAAWRPAQHGQQHAARGKSDDEWARFNPRPVPDTAKSAPEAASGRLGTGFFISEGVLLTNAHLVKGCSEARIGPPGQRTTALVLARDDEDDLVLLRAATHPPAVAALRLSVLHGDAFETYGYPLPGLLASSGNLPTGNITALSGIGDDSRFLQISAPVQPGNSGGPLLDGGGNVVGIVEG